jgi:lactoylglutathione lyase
VTGFFHAGVTVRDMDLALRFYRDGLGLAVHFDQTLDADYLREVLALGFSTIRAVYLTIPGAGFVELLEYSGIERYSAASRPSDFGAGHLCVYVDDVDTMIKRLELHGGRPRSARAVDITSGPNAGARSVYVHDPDGYCVELFQRPRRDELMVAG